MTDRRIKAGGGAARCLAKRGGHRDASAWRRFMYRLVKAQVVPSPLWFVTTTAAESLLSRTREMPPEPPLSFTSGRDIPLVDVYSWAFGTSSERSGVSGIVSRGCEQNEERLSRGTQCHDTGAS
jgi:hypothetical protein